MVLTARECKESPLRDLSHLGIPRISESAATHSSNFAFHENSNPPPTVALTLRNCSESRFRRWTSYILKWDISPRVNTLKPETLFA